MKWDNFGKDEFKKILDGFNKDGTHPDFPVQKVYRGEEFSNMPGSDLMFDLPALVVYEQDDENETPHIGIVFALSNRVDGACINVLSRYNGKMIEHLIEESPSGKQPAYLLLRKHNTMRNVP